MKRILRNPLFYLSLVLALVLGFQIIQNVRGAGIWQGPKCPPPGCLPAAPLDTSTESQEKDGDLNVLGSFRVRGDEGVKIFNFTNEQKFVQILTRANPQINFKDDYHIATLRIHNGVLGFTDINRTSFTPLGSGTGGGASLWQIAPSTENIFYGLGRVGVGTSDTQYGVFQVNQSSNDSRSGIGFKNTNNQTSRIWMDTNDILHIHRSDDPSRGISIGQGGQLGVGVPGVAGRYMLQVKGDSQFYGGGIFDDSLFAGDGLTVLNGLRLINEEGRSRPVCDEDARGMFWYQRRRGVSGDIGKDTLSVCIGDMDGYAGGCFEYISATEAEAKAASTDGNIMKGISTGAVIQRCTGPTRQNPSAPTVCTYKRRVPRESCPATYAWKQFDLKDWEE